MGSAADDAALTAAEAAAGLTVADAADYDAPVPAALTLTVQPHPTGGTADAVDRTLTGTITIQTRPDLDAEDEGIQVTYDVVERRHRQRHRPGGRRARARCRLHGRPEGHHQRHRRPGVRVEAHHGLAEGERRHQTSPSPPIPRPSTACT